MKKFGSSVLLGTALLGLGVTPLSAQSFYRAGVETSAGGFGAAVVVNGSEVIVGEPTNVMRPGLVYVYTRGADGMWSEASSFGASEGDTGDGFGASLATEGDVLLVSSPSGVHSFTRGASGWTEEGMVPAPVGLGDDASFGATMALRDGLAVIGAPGAAEGAGAVYLFRREGAAWTAAGQIEAEGLVAGDAFGSALAFDGDLLLVGAPDRDGRTGAVFAWSSGAAGFDYVGEMAGNGVARNDRFGSSVFISGGTVAIGAVGANGGAGVVHLLTHDAGEWGRVGTIAAFDPSPRGGFGASMARVGDDLWVGAPGASQGRGAVYAFSIDEAGVSGAERLRADAFDGRVQAGRVVASGGDFAVVAAPGADGGAGMVVMFDEAGDSWTAANAVQSPIEEFAAVKGGEMSCSDNAVSEWECSEVDLVSFVPVSELSGDMARGIRTNDNWGWEDPETGRLFALVGMTDRASFIDITDVENPFVVGTLPMTEGANGSSWRDLKTYENHVYIVSDGAGQHGMQVFDLTRLREYEAGDEPVVFDADALYTNIASAHNIVINEESGFAYAVGASSGGETCGGGLHMIDIRTPDAPTFAGCFADPQTGRASTGYSHDAQCVMYRGPDADYAGAEICIGANETAISIADVTDKAAPVAVSRAAYPSVGYSHQGWFTDDHRYFYLNDELDEMQGTERTRTMIWDLADLDDPQLVAEHMGTQESSDHNLYVVGNLMYQSNYQSGLRILDITDPEAPTEVAWFDTVPYGNNGPGFGGSWSNYPFFENGVVIVTSGNEGLFLVRPTVRRTVF